MVSGDIFVNESDILFANIFYKKLAWVFMGKIKSRTVKKG